MSNLTWKEISEMEKKLCKMKWDNVLDLRLTYFDPSPTISQLHKQPTYTMRGYVEHLRSLLHEHRGQMLAEDLFSKDDSLNFFQVKTEVTPQMVEDLKSFYDGENDL